MLCTVVYIWLPKRLRIRQNMAKPLRKDNEISWNILCETKIHGCCCENENVNSRNSFQKQKIASFMNKTKNCRHNTQPIVATKVKAKCSEVVDLPWKC